jgi:hypothetical protein
MDTADDVTLLESALGNPFLFTGREYDRVQDTDSRLSFAYDSGRRPPSRLTPPHLD